MDVVLFELYLGQVKLLKVQKQQRFRREWEAN